MNRRIEDLVPELQAKVRTFLSIIPVEYVVTSTLRTRDEQEALYAQGREPLAEVQRLRAIAHLHPIGDKENAYTVTKCDGVKYKSNHQGGRAIDVVPAGANGGPIWPPGDDPRWEMIGKAGEAAGLKWGGRWPDPDRPHYEG